MKQCNHCNTFKDDTEFAIKRTRPNGTIQRNSICKSCHNHKARNKYAKADKTALYQKIKINKDRYRQQMFDYLSSKQCTDCWNKDIRVLEFDHISNKNFNIGQKVNCTPINTLMTEISKCEIVCANCHRIRTLTRQSSYRTKSTQ